MAHETDWFAPLRTDEARHQRCFWRRVGAGIGVLILLAAAAFLLNGCAAPTKENKEDEPRICFMKGLGRTPDGMHVVAQQCMSQEAFQEMQGK